MRRLNHLPQAHEGADGEVLQSRVAVTESSLQLFLDLLGREIAEQVDEQRGGTAILGIRIFPKPAYALNLLERPELSGLPAIRLQNLIGERSQHLALQEIRLAVRKTEVIH